MGRNAITFCNLLALGSAISLIPMIFLFHKDWTRDKLRALTRKDWGVLTLSAILSSALTPALFLCARPYHRDQRGAGRPDRATALYLAAGSF